MIGWRRFRLVRLAHAFQVLDTNTFGSDVSEYASQAMLGQVQEM